MLCTLLTMQISFYLENRMDFEHGTSAAISRATTPGRSLKMHHRPHTPIRKEFNLHELAMLSLSPIVRSIQHWWLQRAERHYLICADVEQQRAREAQMNVAYYQKRAALARSARN
jgi:heme exporter protein D